MLPSCEELKEIVFFLKIIIFQILSRSILECIQMENMLGFGFDRNLGQPNMVPRIPEESGIEGNCIFSTKEAARSTVPMPSDGLARVGYTLKYDKYHPLRHKVQSSPKMS